MLAQNPRFYLSGDEIFAFAKQQIFVFDRDTIKETDNPVVMITKLKQ